MAFYRSLLGTLALVGIVLGPMNLAQGAMISFGSGADAFEIEFATIDHPGNTADKTGFPNPAGAVGYTYGIGKYEVSRDMITKANLAAGLAIPLWDLSQAGGNGPQRPATGVSWNEAARFVNWLNTSQGFPAAYKFATQPGDSTYNFNENIQLWTAQDPGFDPNNRFRNQLARYALPSANEWYKAAYYDPAANNGSGGYWNSANGTDAPPIPVSSGTAPGTAVYGLTKEQGPADVMQAGGLSPMGTMGQGGNVEEWEETERDLINDNVAGFRGVRGGLWTSGFRYGLSNTFRIDDGPTIECDSLGFRVVVLPEPTAGLTASSVIVIALTMTRARFRFRTS